jgi:methylglutaconyl-CoA hydratase
MKTLEIEQKASVLWVSLARPEVKNAMSAEMMVELRKTFEGISEDIRAVVLRGKGDFFCAGGDIHWMKSSAQKTPEENEADTLTLARMVRAVDECPVPVITQVKGGAFGGGVGLVAASDLVIAEESALFSLSEVKLGLIPATIGPLVMRKIGVSEARRFYLTGKRFSAAEAKHIHLVHELVPAGSLLTVTNDILRDLETSGPLAVREAKALIRSMQGMDLWKPEISETTSKVLSRIRVGAEAQEGLAAFLERRSPSWKGSLRET